MTANDIMSDHVVVIYEDMLIRQVAHLMLRDRVSTFPVVSEKVGIVGIITMTDLFVIIDQTFRDCSAEDFEDKIGEFKGHKIGDIMSRHVVTIRPETTIDEIVRLMVTQGIHAFPVLEDERIVGIVSRHDILNAIFAYD